MVVLQHSRARRIAAALATAIIALVVWAVAGVGKDSPGPQLRTDVRPFNATRAFEDLRYQVALGPRPAGTAANRALGAWLKAQLPHGHFEPIPGGLRNVVGTLPGRRPAVVIGAHYDTDEIPGFVGANDGASGTATLLEVVRDLRRSKPRPQAPELRFVFFDGEEKPAASTDFLRDGLRGSRAYVRAHRREVGAMILLDFVGNRGLSLPREAGSAAGLWAAVRHSARRAGESSYFPPRVRSEVLDDHTLFNRAGIPAVDLIDFDYRYYDQVADTLDKVSAQSLSAAGRTVRELLTRGPLPVARSPHPATGS
ncbi:MAG TPA: M28 family metallopeptidase [Solirubrobacteraceae bacterium]|jgi:acetylornithine deacetylase/succinyl-diaminopimelate desuccinylase-like protein|nr:M28 family metallopeptidase [Solirubrobacteraceae bacterium]